MSFLIMFFFEEVLAYFCLDENGRTQVGEF